MMQRVWPLLAVAAIAGLAACQTAPPPGQALSSSAPTSPSPAASARPSTSATSTQAPSGQYVSLHGAIFTDDGGQVPSAQVDVQCAQYPQLNGTVAAPGGAYYIGNVPIGAVLRLRVSAPGYGVRQQVFTAAYDAPDTMEDPNRVDFGGPDAPLYALSKYPDILETSPSNGTKNLAPTGLSLRFTFSMPITGDAQHQFANLVRVRFPVSAPSPGASPYQDLEAGTSFQEQSAAMTWNASGTEATFNFDAPIAVSAGINSASVLFDQTVPASKWPDGANGLPLGFGVVANTYDGGGAQVHNEVAPFQRDLTAVAVPSPSPGISKADIWGLAHTTTSAFTFASDTTPVNVKSVAAYPATGTTSARFIVTFDKPMRGFPDANLDPEVYSGSNYRFTVGKTEGANDTQNFNSSDPKTGGQSASGQPYFADGTFDTVVVPVSDSAFGDNTVFKFYVAPAIKDAFGGTVAPTVVEGTLP